MAVCTSAMPTTVHSYLAGVASVLPKTSVARTSKACSPTPSPATSAGTSHAVNGAPSSEQANVEPASSAAKANDAVRATVSAGGPSVRVVWGAWIGTTVHSCSTQIASTWPAGSVARTANTWSPTARPVYTCGDVHGTVTPSRKHSNVEPASLEMNWSSAVVDSASSGGALRIVVTGGPSSVHSQVAGVGSAFPDGSIARTSSTCSPPASSSTSCGETHEANEPPSSAHSNVEPNWLEAKVNVAVVLVVPSAGPVSTVVSGAVASAGASTVQVNSAGCSSSRPCGLVAWTASVYSPPPPTSKVERRLAGHHGAAVSEHSYVAPAWSAANVKAAAVVADGSAGVVVNVVTGGPITVHSKRAGVASALPARSTARTSSTCAPGSTLISYGELQGANAAPSSAHSVTSASTGVALSVAVNVKAASSASVSASRRVEQRRLRRRHVRRGRPRVDDGRGDVAGLVRRADLERVRAGASSRELCEHVVAHLAADRALARAVVPGGRVAAVEPALERRAGRARSGRRSP